MWLDEFHVSNKYHDDQMNIMMIKWISLWSNEFHDDQMNIMMIK